MKGFKFLLIGLGILSILISIGIFVSRRNVDNNSRWCDLAASSMEKFETAMNDYETAKAARKPSYELAEYLKKVESAKLNAEGSTNLCVDHQSMKKNWVTRKILLFVLGIVMLGTGFIIGRKRTT
jgi:hypothetical protein